MTPRLRLLSVLQWIGILAGALTWTGQHVVGYGIGQAECAAGGMHWGIENDVWQLTLTACAGLVIALAWVCSLVVFLRTRGENYGDGPEEPRIPQGRLHFFAVAALVANVLFLAIVLMDGLAASFGVLCRQS
ncbi:MAG TPA: hypothetical protein VFJ91_12095 [Gaiellaceae bacterium]|nr:hypothetical protein [Gaiellaceae bacterium]